MIKELNDIDKTPEGILLVAAIGVLMAKVHTDKTPNEVLKILNELTYSQNNKSFTEQLDEEMEKLNK